MFSTGVRTRLSPDATPKKKQEVMAKLRGELIIAARLILENLPRETIASPKINFREPHIKPGQEITSEGDFPGQRNPTFFDSRERLVFLKATPIVPVEFSVAQIKTMESKGASLEISRGNTGGSYGTNKWGRVSFGLYLVGQKRLSSDYVQYFRDG